jgi:hypothetical protein
MVATLVAACGDDDDTGPIASDTAGTSAPSDSSASSTPDGT